MFPIIPILAIVAIFGGVATLKWYSDLTQNDKNRANALALKWFGKQFHQLAQNQQRKIEEAMKDKG